MLAVVKRLILFNATTNCNCLNLMLVICRPGPFHFSLLTYWSPNTYLKTFEICAKSTLQFFFKDPLRIILRLLSLNTCKIRLFNKCIIEYALTLLGPVFFKTLQDRGGGSHFCPRAITHVMHMHIYFKFSMKIAPNKGSKSC